MRVVGLCHLGGTVVPSQWHGRATVMAQQYHSDGRQTAISYLEELAARFLLRQ